MKIVLIAAVAQNDVIGNESGEMPWHSKEEFQHFRNTTLGFPIIMGRKTFESLGKPLKGRLNVILSRDSHILKSFPDIQVFNSLLSAYDYCRSKDYEKVFVIGGGHVFKEAIDEADEMIISRMNFNAEGNVYFPKIDAERWNISKTEQRSEFKIFYYVKNTYEFSKD